MRPRTTSRVSLTAMLGTPVTDAQGNVRGKLKDVAVATGAEAGRVAGLVLKTRQGLQIVPSNQVMETPSGTLELRSPSALSPLRGDENYLFLQQASTMWIWNGWAMARCICSASPRWR